MIRKAIIYLVLPFCLGALGLTTVGYGAQAPVFRRQIAWAERGVWLKADLHLHTRFSDGGQTADVLTRAAVARGCDVVAITDHSDDELKAATPAYLDAIRAIRVEHPNLVVVAGLEWNIPPGKGQEHANVLFPSRMETLDRLSTFKDRFDDWNRKGENPELGDAALRWLTPSDGTLPLPVVTINHPSRKPSSTSAPKIMFEHWKTVSPVVIGIEGAPGHQRAAPLGAVQRHRDAGGSLGPDRGGGRWSVGHVVGAGTRRVGGHGELRFPQ